MTATRPEELTSRIQKGGALLGDMRQLVRHWGEKPEGMPPGQFVKSILPKATQARANDTYSRAFLPRFIEGSPENAWVLCEALEKCNPAPEIVRAFYYWITARAEPILHRYVTGELFDQARSGIAGVSSEDLAGWIRRACSEEGKEWSATVTIKVARAMLAALRDFGVLAGRARKTISDAELPLETFCLIAFCLRMVLRDNRDLASHEDWRLFLLSPRHVERLLLEAHQYKWLHYQVAGAITRIEFPAESFPSYVRSILAS